MTNNININETLKELASYTKMAEELKVEIDRLTAETKQYMTENELTEVFTEDMTVGARYTEVISNRFDTTSFKKQFSEIYTAFLKKSTSMRFSLSK